MLPDYYAVLGGSTKATALAIKQAYRTRARVAHPDHGGSHEAMLQINEAYAILNNPLAREHYDLARASQFDVTAQYYAQEDASKARQHAQEYPRTWSDFQTWLVKDFTEAEYGKDEGFPTTNNSVSGGWFIAIGARIAQIMPGKLMIFIAMEKLQLKFLHRELFMGVRMRLKNSCSWLKRRPHF